MVWIVFTKCNDQQAHQELIKVKKLIDRRGFEKNVEGNLKEKTDGETQKSVRFADGESVISKSPSKVKSSSKPEKVNSRWVVPISKPEESISKRPMRRIKIDEVGKCG